MAVVDLAKQVGTSKGDLSVFNGSTLVRLPVGSDGQVLKADSGEAAGVKWAADPVELVVACSDESTAIDSTGTKVTFRMPYAMTLTAVRASLTTADTTGITVDINEGGTSVLSTKLTIDAGEKSSTTAATAAVISDGALADDAEITVDVDSVGNGVATGLKVALIGTRA